MEPHRISLQICIEALRGLSNAGVDKLHALICADELALWFYGQRRRAKTQIGIVLLTCIKLMLVSCLFKLSLSQLRL